MDVAEYKANGKNSDDDEINRKRDQPTSRKLIHMEESALEK